MIPNFLLRAFPANVRARGTRYFAEGHVTELRSGPGRISARVLGTLTYAVLLEAKAEDIVFTCECPFSEDQGPCKHSWATILAADANGMLAVLLEYAADGINASEDDSPEYEETYEDFDEEAFPRYSARHRSRQTPQKKARWLGLVDAARLEQLDSRASRESQPWPDDRRLVYLLNLTSPSTSDGLPVELATEKQRKDGSFEPPRQLRVPLETWLSHPDSRDRLIARLLVGAPELYLAPLSAPSRYVMPRAAFDTTLRLICETQRCYVRASQGNPLVGPVAWDVGIPWRFHCEIVSGETAGTYSLLGYLSREGEKVPIDAATHLHRSGIVILDGKLARLDSETPFAFLEELRRDPATVSRQEFPAMLEALLALQRPPLLSLPPELVHQESAPEPTPRLDIAMPPGSGWSRRNEAIVFFDYGDGIVVNSADNRQVILDAAGKRIVRRNRVSEQRALERLTRLGIRRNNWDHHGTFEITRAYGLEIEIRKLSLEGWQVQAGGTPYRLLTDVRTTVRSGIDWFDLETVVRFGDHEARLSDIAEAVRREHQSVLLSDGSTGIIGEEWKRRLTLLATTGTVSGKVTRFARSQTGLLDALLALLPNVGVDETFETARTELRNFERVTPLDAPSSFTGELRPYQKEGLGWLNFLQRFRLGGCLADDMGLGKTIQILALLESRRLAGAGASLVVVPRSLVFNWKQEATRFAPKLRVLEHVGSARNTNAPELSNVDLVLTTYGTLRRDAPVLSQTEFDYAILDEAQNIKNASTASAKAARLLRAKHRLALSGTPIENRIQELWSLMEFLNPGMLGASSSFARLTKLTQTSESSDEKSHSLWSSALRPVILRRTKDQVAPELPQRVEQTLMVELEGSQRKLYDQLLGEYRRELLPRVDRVGIAKSKMQILEALLRLRQMACHPALIDPRKSGDESAKLDVLLPKLVEAHEEGHKALVFSQFTSFLALLQKRLLVEKVPFEYLDGKTRDREARVQRFQTDADCPLFLISLKAGGHGLNLTAADYVFLLDPWWNPAVEAQAIDRAHRIGQARRVIATRLVARDTIEEKILELQRTKRDLADAILGADQGVIAKIGRAELGMLLGESGIKAS